jgi:hypothetical protein
VGFGEEPVRRLLGAAAGAPGLIAELRAALAAHTAGADPFDDVTLLAVGRLL